MSVFGRSTFSAASYAAARPTYPPSLFESVMNFHNSQSSDNAGSSSRTLLDLGCGHGLISRALSPHFKQVIALDPSMGMIKQATESTKIPHIKFQQGRSEDLSFIPDQSIDLVVAGQAAHWFDYSKLWPELSRVVKPGGSLAFWGYKDNVLIGHSRANKIFDKFCYATGNIEPGLRGMADYWEQPGRSILRNLLREVSPPSSEWENVERVLFDVDPDATEVPESAWMTKTITLGSLESYVRTFSAFQGWKDAHPNVNSRAQGGEGDIADVLMDRIVESEPIWKKMGDWRDAEAQTVWGTYILLAHRKK